MPLASFFSLSGYSFLHSSLFSLNRFGFLYHLVLLEKIGSFSLLLVGGFEKEASLSPA